MPDALFRFDVSPALGYGHMMRSSILANSLGRLGWNVAAAVNEDGVEYVRRLDTFARVLPVPDGCDEAKFLSDSVPQGCDLLVIDDYAWTADVERRVRGWAKRIAAVDDLPLRDHDADVLLCPSLGVEEAEFSRLVPRRCAVLVGASYVLISPALVSLRGRAAERRARPKRVERSLDFDGGRQNCPCSRRHSRLRVGRLAGRVDRPGHHRRRRRARNRRRPERASQYAPAAGAHAECRSGRRCGRRIGAGALLSRLAVNCAADGGQPGATGRGARRKWARSRSRQP